MARAEQMGKAYLILGPESSGTRCVTRILLDAGCHGGAGHEQEFDRAPPRGVSPVVWRRSIPHGKEWPDITRMVNVLKANGYEVKAIATTRDWHPAIESQLKARHVGSREEARANLRRAYPFIFWHLAETKIPFWVVSYEALVARPKKVVGKLMEALGLPVPGKIEIFDGNEKYYAD